MIYFDGKALDKYYADYLTNFNSNIIPTTWEAWDTLFGGFKRGGLQLICAQTNTGKTSLLIAMAKLAVKANLRTLYVCREEAWYEIARYFADSNQHFSDKLTIAQYEDGDLQAKGIQGSYDVIFYDYLGADSYAATDNKAEWQVLRDAADALHRYAATHNTAIVTACQANVGLDKVIGQCHDASYVSYSTKIMAKVDDAVYMARNEAGSLVMWQIKCRGRKRCDLLQLVHLNLETKEIIRD